MPPHACRVLVIEDEAFILLMIEEALSGADCNAILATRGEDALVLAHQHRPDLVVMDLRLGRETVGPDFLTQLREAVPSPLPVVIASGFRLSEDERHEYDLAGGGPPVSLLQKPYAPEDLVTAVLAGLRKVGA